MEVDLFSSVVSEEDTFEVDVENDNFGVEGEGERCGICMDIVVDRGVLDCCQHWFCFLCIDNWASITNLCPLCQNEFQLITCVPVYDTIGGSKTDEDSDLRDDDWRAEGENNTLSFPSYYIDENAVTCLDGDGCKIRSGSVTYEETLNFDTSIACDSCDIWYHAYCVGFNPEGADVDSWLCPRCIFSEAQNIPGFRETQRTQNQLDSESVDRRFLVDTYSGKVCISVADAGETAVVVSRIDGEHVEEPIANEQHTQELSNHHETEISMLQPDSSSPGLRNSLDHGIIDTQPEATVPCAELHESIIKSEPNESDSRICLNPGLSLDATMSEDDKTEVILDSNDSLHDPSGQSISIDETLGDGKAEVAPNICEKRKRTEVAPNIDETLGDGKAEIAPNIGEKRKRTDYSFLTNDEDGYDEVRLGSGSSTRKVKAREGIQRISSNDPAHISASDDDQKADSRVESSADETGVNRATKKSLSVDIMSIVQDKEPKIAKRLTRQKEVDNRAKVEKNAAGLRMKKIMRRPSDDQESADAFQKLRKEIREAVRKKPSDDFGKSNFDPNLLAAFRVAVAGSATGPVKKAFAKGKKFIFQKGSTRENLTKKIYATSNGKRRRAWDRECEVEFWRHRCITTSKREKIETLKSVLNLLKKSPETKNVEHDYEEKAKAPILSRLYLADASVFPRKDDIKPLSVLKAAQMATKPSPDHSNVKSADINEILTQGNTSAADDKNIEDTCAQKNGVASGKLNSDRQLNKSSFQKKTACKTDIKTDKRKWALEVLARKTASNNTSGVHQKQDNAAFKGNYPLLAELPTDMRPKLAPIHHNKVPVSVRQAQLYRLTEHFLKMANLSSTRRAAATELAVADAINIEKQVADRSNSKSVYLNLCSQEIRRHKNFNTSSTPVESTPSTPLPVSNESKESSSLSLDSETEAALRAAGLLSDSPPCSPHNSVEDVDHDGSSVMEVDEEETEDIFGMDSHPDLDIYGDFEYDLDEEYDMGASVIKPSESQAEEGESKVKVVFSTLISNKTESETDTPLNASSLLGSSAVDDNKADSVPIPAHTSMDGEDEELSLAECEALYGPEKELLVNKYPSTECSGLQSSNNLKVKKPEKNENNSAPASCVGVKSPTSSQVVKNVEVKKPGENENDSAPVSCVGVKSPTSSKVVKNLEVKKPGENENDSAPASCVGEKSPTSSQVVKNTEEEKNGDPKVDKKSRHVDSVHKKVEAYIKEHIRPLCKSGVITVEQYRWAVAKTTDKVMKYHSKAKNANFLIKEGEKVKKLAEQYVDAAHHKEK